MKKPETYEQLVKLINPEDLDEIFAFSGRNDQKSQPHWELRRKYSDVIYQSMKTHSSDIKDWRSPNPYADISPVEDFYTTLVRCIQDFYWWSHRFDHMYASVYKRVMNALEISITAEEIDKHFKDDASAKKT